MLEAGYGKSEIARTIGVNKSTVTREVSRNADGRSGAYRHALAQRKAEERKRSKPQAVALTPEAKAYVEQKLTQDRWAPEQVSERTKWAGGIRVSTTTLYRHIASDRKAGGTLHEYLRRGKPYRRLTGRYTDGRGCIHNRLDISERPPEVDARVRFGDLEVDTALGVPIGLGFSALIFFGSFLYQDKKEHVNGSLESFPFCDATVTPCSLGYAWRASLLARDYPYYKYYAPTGLEALVVVRGKRPHPSPSPDRRGEKHLGDLIAGPKSPLSGEI